MIISIKNDGDITLGNCGDSESVFLSGKMLTALAVNMRVQVYARKSKKNSFAETMCFTTGVVTEQHVPLWIFLTDLFGKKFKRTAVSQELQPTTWLAFHGKGRTEAHCRNMYHTSGFFLTSSFAFLCHLSYSAIKWCQIRIDFKEMQMRCNHECRGFDSFSIWIMQRKINEGDDFSTNVG